MKRTSLAKYSQDGYIRLTMLELHAVRLVHLLSAEDTSVKGALAQLSIPCRAAGYTEWWVPAMQLSVGWDWYVDARDAGVCMAPWDVRSNIMVLTVGRTDVGAKASELLLKGHVRNLPWEHHVAATLNGFSASVGHLAAVGRPARLH